MPIAWLANASVVLSVRRLNELQNFRGWRSRPKYRTDFTIKEGLTVVFWNDASTKHNHVIEAFSSQQFAYFWEQVSMRS